MIQNDSRLLGPQGVPVQRSAPAGSGGGSDNAGSADKFLIAPPSVSLPKGGGAVRAIGEKFSANPVTGTGAMTVPIALSPGRGGFGPQLALSYDSGAGQSVFGLGWSVGVSSIVRKSDRGLPRYDDDEESDVFLLAGADDLVPVVDAATGARAVQPIRLSGTDYQVFAYRPRVEGLFARIERWSVAGRPRDTRWRTISRDNVTTWYGRDDESRIADPNDPDRVFQWLVCRTHDDKGNLAVYRYVDDTGLRVDTASVWESNRYPVSRRAQRSLKRILYGNPPPSYRPPTGADAPDVLPTAWMFEAVFDYGDHTGPFPGPQPDAPPPPRTDPFSNHRAGFEIRTQRMCRRVLMFHHFPNAPGVGANCLVRSTNLTHEFADPAADPLKPGHAVLRSVSQWSFQRTPAGSLEPYAARQRPPVDFVYSRPVVDPVLHSIAASELPNLPVGTQGPGYRWVDLDGEGLSGVLAETTGAWHYQHSLGDGRFGPLRTVARVPAMALDAQSRYQLMDLSGNGEVDVVALGGPTPGFHERDREQGWKRHVPFASLPQIDWQDPNLRFVDLTGDGHADALITEHDVFTWYPSLDERGFDAAQRERQARNEDDGPKLLFADGTQTIFLADMCGDGLTDLVRIRNAEVCYWPNLGYGRFGRKVTLGNSPVFDAPELFDPSRIRLTDIDGSGPIDLIYLGRDGACLYFNRGGNRFSDALTVALPPATHNLDAVQVADMLGKGTACLVWNSHLPADADRPVRYIDLMGQKPHLLIRVDNNLGATTEIDYLPSTRFYLDDQDNGTPWATRLPFPVHCVSTVTVRDKWRGTRFSSSYSYHHGHYDGVEREFRGFGRVEQVDTQSFASTAEANRDSPFVTADQRLYQPPVKSVSWFHTGAAEDRDRILALFAQEYFPARHAAAFDAAGYREPPIPQPVVDARSGPALSADEWREAMRACKGMPLRQEVYELDFEALQSRGEHRPTRIFAATQHGCHIVRLQPRGTGQHAVFLVAPGESFTCHYEVDLTQTTLEPDPRVAHTLPLRVDALGRTLQSVAVVYPRRLAFSDDNLSDEQVAVIDGVQRERHIAYTEARFTGELPPDAWNHRLSMPCESRTYELTGDHALTGFVPHSGPYFSAADFRAFALSGRLPGQGAKPVGRTDYHRQPVDDSARKRLVEHTRSLYMDAGDAVERPSTPLPFGTHDARGLKYEDYKLALTDGLLAEVFETRLQDEVEPGRSALSLLADAGRSGYVAGTLIDPTLTGQYWMRSGIAGFGDDAAYDARRHFYLPIGYADPFGNRTTLRYDADDLFIETTVDPRGNTASVVAFDHRVLGPARLRDANRNESAVAFDILGLTVASAALGKVTPGAPETTETGATLADLGLSELNPPEAEIAAFFDAQGWDGRERTWLGKARARHLYHFGETRDAASAVTQWAAAPSAACSLVRERHEVDLPNTPANAIPLQVAIAYADGAGQTFVTKTQAEPEAPGGPLRWIANGKTIVNNKGKPVLQYEPYFSTDQNGVPDRRFREPRAEGVSPVLVYDATGRLVRTDFPDGTHSRVVVTPWFSRSFDRTDTVLVPGNRWYAERSASTDAEQRRAAALAALHAGSVDGTPSETHFDSLGRDVASIAHNRTPAAGNSNVPLMQRPWTDERHLSFTRLDAEGKALWIQDARGNLVVQYLRRDAPDPALGKTLNQVAPERYVPCYDLAGNLLFQHSMDAGDRWTLADAAGKALLSWDRNEFRTNAGAVSQNRVLLTRCDALHRPVEKWLTTSDLAGQVTGRFLVEAFEHCDTDTAVDLGDAQRHNLIGQTLRHWDASGRSTVERVDVNGKPVHVTRTLARVDSARDGEAALHWPAADAQRVALLDPDTFIHLTENDALGRMTRLYNWHRDVTFAADGTRQNTPGATNRVAIYQPRYDQRGDLASEWVYVRAAKTTVAGQVVANTAQARSIEAIRSITRNAKGQKLEMTLGNGTLTTCRYDPDSFRLDTQKTTRASAPAGVQDLRFTYDPVGNVTHLNDAAQATVWSRNAEIDASHRYTYDAMYRLIEATGRENVAAPPPTRDGPWPAAAFPVGDVPRPCTQRYVYDAVGNFLSMQQLPGAGNGFSRGYEAHPDSNCLWRTWHGAATWDDADLDQRVEYGHDTHGNMLNLNRVVIPPPLSADQQSGLSLRWDTQDMISMFDLGGGGTARYQYDGERQRTRKHITRNTANGGGTVVEQRVYLGGFELFTRSDPQGRIVEEIETQHLFEGESRVLLVDDVVRAAGGTTPTLFRFQYANQIGSVTAELDAAAQLISYEECHPYGSPAYVVTDARREVPARRYRYSGMERDEESGLGYHGLRYRLPSLGPWLSPDPIGIGDGLNVYRYVRSNPVSNCDPSGSQTVGTMRGIAEVARRDLAEKQRLLNHMAHNPEQYPTVTEKTKAAMRAEINALEKTAGSWEARADEHTDFHKNVGLPVVAGAGVLAVGAPAVGVSAGGAALLSTLGVGSGMGAGFSTVRQGAQMLDGSRSSFSGLEVVESAGWGGAIAPAAVSYAPVRVALVGAGVHSGYNEIKRGNTVTGVFDIATSLVPEVASRARAKALAGSKTPKGGGGPETVLPRFATAEEAMAHAEALSLANTNLNPHVARVQRFSSKFKLLEEWFEVSEGLGADTLQGNAAGHTEAKVTTGSYSKGDVLVIESLGTPYGANPRPALQACAQCSQAMTTASREQGIFILYDFLARARLPDLLLFTPTEGRVPKGSGPYK